MEEELVNVSNIISDCLNLYSDIINQCNESKYKLIGYIKKKIYLRKLYSIIDKYTKSNVPLSVDQLSEYFKYLFSTYVPNGQYGIIKYILCIDNSNIIEAYIKNDNINAIIKIDSRDRSKKLSLHLLVNNSESNSSYDVKLAKLESKNPDIKDIVSDIDKLLKNDIYHYIIENISEEEK